MADAMINSVYGIMALVREREIENWSKVGLFLSRSIQVGTWRLWRWGMVFVVEELVKVLFWHMTSQVHCKPHWLFLSKWLLCFFKS